MSPFPLSADRAALRAAVVGQGAGRAARPALGARQGRLAARAAEETRATLAAEGRSPITVGVTGIWNLAVGVTGIYNNGGCGAVEKPLLAVILSAAKNLKCPDVPGLEILHFVQDDRKAGFSTAPVSPESTLTPKAPRPAPGRAGPRPRGRK